jgi:16S rRNA C967 or C1407 C5-methylase (RsmB/RsmF family)
VYSTCTITEGENEGNVARVLEKFDAQLLPSGIDCGHPGLESSVLSKNDQQKVKRFWPHLDDCIGYFIAKFRRVS